MRGWVLAGGASSRFGRDKATVEVEGIPMVLRVARAMQAAGLQVGIVAKDRRLDHLGLPVLVEPLEPRHPALGVAVALELGEAVFAPCDLPWIPPEAFLALGPASVAFDGHVHPLVARYPGSWAGRAREIAEGGHAAKKLADGAERVAMPTSWLRNINRPIDLEP
ncbi:MAG TPA: NTP transferase domain-containing protein [Myxococcota bacterium]|nr:NTP transferase domain-containing protein [Myxococcota bacterium]